MTCKGGFRLIVIPEESLPFQNMLNNELKS